MTAEHPDAVETPAARPVEQAGSPISLGRLEAVRGPAPPPAEIIVDGRRVPVPPGGLTIGRHGRCDVVVTSALASRAHARILVAGSRHYVADLGSRNGTSLNGERLRGESRWLTTGDAIGVGGESLRYVCLEPPRAASPLGPIVIPLDRERLRLGRDASNDVVLDDPNVSRLHATVVARKGQVEVIDLGSRNGTRVNGEPVRRAAIRPGSEIGIGAFRLLWDGRAFVRRADHGALRLDAEGSRCP
jgi:pSer/pThr/pTyr-binding forkhead associated (FHA) protein